MILSGFGQQAGLIKIRPTGEVVTPTPLPSFAPPTSLPFWQQPPAAPPAAPPVVTPPVVPPITPSQPGTVLPISPSLEPYPPAQAPPVVQAGMGMGGVLAIAAGLGVLGLVYFMRRK